MNLGRIGYWLSKGRHHNRASPLYLFLDIGLTTPFSIALDQEYNLIAFRRPGCVTRWRGGLAVAVSVGDNANHAALQNNGLQTKLPRVAISGDNAGFRLLYYVEMLFLC